MPVSFKTRRRQKRTRRPARLIPSPTLITNGGVVQESGVILEIPIPLTGEIHSGCVMVTGVREDGMPLRVDTSSSGTGAFYKVVVHEGWNDLEDLSLGVEKGDTLKVAIPEMFVSGLTVSFSALLSMNAEGKKLPQLEDLKDAVREEESRRLESLEYPDRPGESEEHVEAEGSEANEAPTGD